MEVQKNEAIEINSTDNQPIFNQPDTSNHVNVYLNEYSLPPSLTDLVLANNETNNNNMNNSNNQNNNDTISPFTVMNDFTSNINFDGTQIAGIIIQPNQAYNSNQIYILHNNSSSQLQPQSQQNGVFQISQPIEHLSQLMPTELHNPARLDLLEENNKTLVEMNAQPLNHTQVEPIYFNDASSSFMPVVEMNHESSSRLHNVGQLIENEINQFEAGYTLKGQTVVKAKIPLFLRFLLKLLILLK